jgi:hypothetical protein
VFRSQHARPVLKDLSAIDDMFGVEHVFKVAHEIQPHWVFHQGSKSRFTTPMPCSAEIEPPYLIVAKWTAVFTPLLCSRNLTVSLPAGWMTL